MGSKNDICGSCSQSFEGIGPISCHEEYTRNHLPTPSYEPQGWLPGLLVVKLHFFRLKVDFIEIDALPMTFFMEKKSREGPLKPFLGSGWGKVRL